MAQQQPKRVFRQVFEAYMAQTYDAGRQVVKILSRQAIVEAFRPLKEAVDMALQSRNSGHPSYGVDEESAGLLPDYPHLQLLWRMMEQQLPARSGDGNYDRQEAVRAVFTGMMQEGGGRLAAYVEQMLGAFAADHHGGHVRPETYVHILTVTADLVGLVMAATPAEQAQLGLQQPMPQGLWELAVAALLHDSGKLAVPEPVLYAGKLKQHGTAEKELDSQNFNIIKQHSRISAENLMFLHQEGFISGDAYHRIYAMVRNHHPKYPEELESPPAVVRLLTALDTYNAVTHERGYRETAPSPHDEAMKMAQPPAGAADRLGYEIFAAIVARGYQPHAEKHAGVLRAVQTKEEGALALRAASDVDKALYEQSIREFARGQVHSPGK